MKLRPLYRSIAVRGEDVDVENRTIKLTFSSEEPVDRWFGKEILDHKKASVDLSRLNDGAPFLVNHDGDQLAGVVEKSIIKEKRGHATVRIGNSDFASEILDDIKNGIRKNISFGYRISKMVLESSSDEEGDTYRATQWQPFEISSVPIPADNTIGVGRSQEEYEIEVEGEDNSSDEDYVPSLELKEKELELIEKSL